MQCTRRARKNARCPMPVCQCLRFLCSHSSAHTISFRSHWMPIRPKQQPAHSAVASTASIHPRTPKLGQWIEYKPITLWPIEKLCFHFRLYPFICVCCTVCIGAFTRTHTALAAAHWMYKKRKNIQFDRAATRKHPNPWRNEYRVYYDGKLYADTPNKCF